MDNTFTAHRPSSDILPEVKIDVLHALEDFLEAYDDKTSVVVLEAVANALDAKATRLDVKMYNQHISFRDNGVGMSKKQFCAYHDISTSNKRRGTSIGFAGVGAKVYLGVWKQTVIHTETYGPDGPFASDLRITYGKIRWEKRPTTTSILTRGTLYNVKLRVKDYRKLDAKIRDIILDHFNTAMLNGLTVTINGDRLEPWNPSHKDHIEGTANANKSRFPVVLTVCHDVVPTKYRHVQYQVRGKTVTTRKLDWAPDIKEQYRDRIHCVVRADACSKHMKLDKCSFKGGPGAVHYMYSAVEKWLRETLRDKGYVDALTGDVQRNPRVSMFFQKIFQDPKYRWLDPGAAASLGTKTGTGAGGSRRGRAKNDGNIVKSRKNAKPTGSGGTRRGNRGGSGIDIALIPNKEDPRDGWIDPDSNNFVCNTEHPLYRKYAKNIEARNLRVKQVMFGVLIAHGIKSRKADVSVAEAFDTQRDLMTLARNLRVVP